MHETTKCSYSEFLLFSSLSVAAECDEYEYGSASWERCLGAQTLGSADKSLNEVYFELRSALGKPELSSKLKMLISSQRAWLSYRNKSCALIHALKDGMHNVHEDLCQSELATERTKFLQAILDEL